MILELLIEYRICGDHSWDIGTAGDQQTAINTNTGTAAIQKLVEDVMNVKAAERAGQIPEIRPPNPSRCPFLDPF